MEASMKSRWSLSSSGEKLDLSMNYRMLMCFIMLLKLRLVLTKK